MGLGLVIGALAGLLLASVGWNAVLLFTRQDIAKAHQLAMQECRDQARAAELRSHEQIDAMLDRIHTDPRIEIRAAVPDVPPIADDRPYITDHEYDDARWNDFTGVEEGN